MFNMFGGLLGLIIFALDIWAIASIINTNEPVGTKILWILLVAVLPVVGLIIWWFAGPKANYNRM
ncbi:PLDc N-terminal domain-containing protein [Paracoccus jiaweipingae]|uniref:PLDc N-terminal domain-containing protein n=1 Tax=unclassified Paracoccus (in: a-proteobacteria) TaxID=2688777 RepID=UPI0037B74101